MSQSRLPNECGDHHDVLHDVEVLECLLSKGAPAICLCSAGGEFTRYKAFEPASPGTLYAYQFVPNQVGYYRVQLQILQPALLAGDFQCLQCYIVMLPTPAEPL